MRIVNQVVLSIVIGLALSSVCAGSEFCSDTQCKSLERQYYNGEYKKIISNIDNNNRYSNGSIFYIGMSYTILAERASSAQEKEELFRKAVAVGYNPAYMSLYDLYSKESPKKAVVFLRLYLKTNPDDPNPFFEMGRIEFSQNKIKAADTHLRKARKLSNGHTAAIDWLLFKANYILGNYKFAKEMVEDALAQAELQGEIRELMKDPRFSGIGKRPEFKDYRALFRTANKNNRDTHDK